jgi:hypothetical protein
MNKNDETNDEENKELTEELDEEFDEELNEELDEEFDEELNEELNKELNENDDDDDDEYNGDGTEWTVENQIQLTKVIQKLKYNRLISNFYYYEMKHVEGKWSWIIILISTFTSGITIINNIDESKLPFTNLKTIVNATLTVSSMATSLIAAWIKKQQYIEKINELDRYKNKINKLVEELEFELTKSEGDRLAYGEFKNKYHPLITEHLTFEPPMSPKQWKKCIKDITKNYPELLVMDGSDENKIWPWYSISRISKNTVSKREKTKFYTDIESNNRNCCNKPKTED